MKINLNDEIAKGAQKNTDPNRKGFPKAFTFFFIFISILRVRFFICTGPRYNDSKPLKMFRIISFLLGQNWGFHD